MCRRMNKNDLLELLSSLKIDKEEFWILSSGALVLRGIYPDAGDLDIAVTNKGLEQVKSNYTIIPKENGWFIVTDKIECVCDGDIEKLKYKPEKIGDYYVQNIQEYLEFLKSSVREKDKLRITIVKEYIENNSKEER